MTTLLDDVGTYLQTNGVGTIGTTLFLSYMPEAPDLCVAVYEFVGLQPMQTMSGAADVKNERPRLQIAARGAPQDYVAARAKVQTCYGLLCNLVDSVLGTTRYISFVPIDSPAPIGRDDSQRPTIVCNFQAFLARN